MAGALTFLVLVWRPCRTSWLIVGTKTLLLLCQYGAVGTDRGGRSSVADRPAGRSGRDRCCVGWWRNGRRRTRRRRTPPEATKAEYIGGPESVSNVRGRVAQSDNVALDDALAMNEHRPDAQ